MVPETATNLTQGLPFWMPWNGLAYGWPLLLLQVACVIHVARNGRPYWWIWIIMAFPFVGALAYGAVELRPPAGTLNWKEILWRLKGSRERIRIREAALEESPTADHCVALATELRNAGLHRRASEVLAAGLVGAFRNDTRLLLMLADCHLQLGEPDVAGGCLDRCTERLRNDEQRAIGLYRGRILSMRGRVSEAEPMLRELSKGRRSEAPRFYLAETLAQAGRTDEANEILDDIIKCYRNGTPVYRRLERTWFQAAKQAKRVKIRDGS